MKRRRVTVRQVAAEAGVSITTIPSVQEHFGLWSMYRFHIEDPVRFSTSLKFSIEHGHPDDYSSVACSYQTGQHAEHAELPPVEERLPGRWPEHGLWDE